MDAHVSPGVHALLLLLIVVVVFPAWWVCVQIHCHVLAALCCVMPAPVVVREGIIFCLNVASIHICSPSSLAASMNCIFHVLLSLSCCNLSRRSPSGMYAGVFIFVVVRIYLLTFNRAGTNVILLLYFARILEQFFWGRVIAASSLCAK